jgi:hypothetical protein
MTNCHGLPNSPQHPTGARCARDQRVSGKSRWADEEVVVKA